MGGTIAPLKGLLLPHRFTWTYPSIEPALATVIKTRSSVHPHAVLHIQVSSNARACAQSLYHCYPCFRVVMQFGQNGRHHRQQREKKDNKNCGYRSIARRHTWPLLTVRFGLLPHGKKRALAPVRIHNVIHHPMEWRTHCRTLVSTLDASLVQRGPLQQAL